jgi:two-component system cell cycle sensor histidine kinase/response regulator CckA
MRNPKEDDRHDPGLGQGASTVVYAYDLSGKITFLNHEGERIWGYSREEACRMNIAEMIGPQIAGRIREQIIREASERVGTVYEIDIIAKDGRRIPVEVSTRVVVRDGERIEVQGIAVPSVIRNQSSSSTALRCLDPDFFYGNAPGLANHRNNK